MSHTYKERAGDIVDAWSCAHTTMEVQQGLPKWATLTGLQNLIEASFKEYEDRIEELQDKIEELTGQISDMSS